VTLALAGGNPTRTYVTRCTISAPKLTLAFAGVGAVVVAVKKILSTRKK